MSRRSTVERIFVAQAAAVGSPGMTLVNPVTGIIVAPKNVVIAAGAGAVEASLTSNGVPFVHINVPVGATEQVLLPDGLELGISSGVELVTDATTDVTLYYCLYDENPGITKVESRAQSFQNVTTIRTPNQFGNQAKT